MARSWFDTDLSADEWLACLYQCGFACFDCYQPFGDGKQALGPVLVVSDYEDRAEEGNSEPYYVAVCMACQAQYHDQFNFSGSSQSKGL